MPAPYPTLLEVIRVLQADDDVIQAGIDSPGSAAWGVEYALIKAERIAAGVWAGTP